MESHGERVWKPGSFHGVPLIAQFGYGTGGRHDSWQRMQWYASFIGVSTAGDGYSGTPWTRSSEVSVLVSGRLRRLR